MSQAETLRGRALAPRAAGFSPLYLLPFGFLIPDIVSLDIGVIRLPLMRMLLLGLAFPAAIGFLTRPGRRFYPHDWFFFLGLFWMLAMRMLNYGLGGLEQAGIFFLDYGVIYMALHAYGRDAATLRRMLDIFIVIVIVLGAAGLVEALARAPLVLDFFYKLMGHGGFSVDDSASAANHYRWGLLRAMTTFRHPILYGVFCAAFFSFAFYSLRRPLLRAGAVAAATFLSLSGGPLVALFVQMQICVVEVLSRKIRNRFRIIGLALAAFLLVVHFSAQSGLYRLVQLFTFSGASASFRALIWDYAIDDVWRHPVFGFRIGEWTRPFWMPVSIDNHWLAMAMLGGLPYVALLALTVVAMMRRVFSRPDGEIAPELNLLRRGWAASMAAMCVAGSTVYFFDRAQPTFALIIGLGAVIARMVDESAAAPKADAPPPGPAAPRRARTVI